MVPEHSHVEQYSVTDFSRLRRASHKSILRERKLLPPSSGKSEEEFKYKFRFLFLISY